MGGAFVVSASCPAAPPAPSSLCFRLWGQWGKKKGNAKEAKKRKFFSWLGRFVFSGPARLCSGLCLVLCSPLMWQWIFFCTQLSCSLIFLSKWSVTAFEVPLRWLLWTGHKQSCPVLSYAVPAQSGKHSLPRTNSRNKESLFTTEPLFFFSNFSFIEVFKIVRYLKCILWFDMHCKRIPALSLINSSTTSHIYLLFFGENIQVPHSS